MVYIRGDGARVTAAQKITGAPGGRSSVGLNQIAAAPGSWEHQEEKRDHLQQITTGYFSKSGAYIPLEAIEISRLKRLTG